MGYPMTYNRIVKRNNLLGPRTLFLHVLKDDLQRLKTDTLDDKHLSMYAEAFGCSVDQARSGFRLFFGREEN